MFIGEDVTYRDDVLVNRSSSGLAGCGDDSVTTSVPSGMARIIIAGVAAFSILASAYSPAHVQSDYYEGTPQATHDVASEGRSHHETSGIQELDRLVSSFKDYAADERLPIDDIVGRAVVALEAEPTSASAVSEKARELALDDIRSLDNDKPMG